MTILIENHKGKIVVISEENECEKFTVTIPVHHHDSGDNFGKFLHQFLGFFKDFGHFCIRWGQNRRFST